MKYSCRFHGWPKDMTTKEIKLKIECSSFDCCFTSLQDFILRLKLRPGSDAVLHMSRIKFNELSSCEVRRLNQFEMADIIRIGLAILHAWLSRD